MEKKKKKMKIFNNVLLVREKLTMFVYIQAVI